MRRLELERAPIEPLGFVERLADVPQPAQVDVRGDVRRVGRDRVAIGALGFGRRADLLAFERGLEQVVGRRRGAQRALHGLARERRDFLAELANRRSRAPFASTRAPSCSRCRERSTRSPSICTRTAESGRSVGSWLASACSAFVMRRAGTLASMSPFAVRSSTRSWNVKLARPALSRCGVDDAGAHQRADARTSRVRAARRPRASSTPSSASTWRRASSRRLSAWQRVSSRRPRLARASCRRRGSPSALP